MGTTLSLAPVASQSICQGTMLEWCSIPVMRISSPGSIRGRTKLEATRLTASVVPRVKTISRLSAAPRWLLILVRALS